MSKRRRIKHLGERVRILDEDIFVRFVTRLGPGGKGYDGWCEPPGTTNRSILVRRGQDEKNELDTIVHECLHVADWHKDEKEWVETVANGISDALWKLGWRKTPNS